MITVHHLGVSQSERIVWLCEELGIPYELKVYDRDPNTRMAPASYKVLSPMGIAPVITDGKLVLAESGAIIEYIIGKYGKGRLAVFPDSAEWPNYLFWFHFANGTFMPSAMLGVLQGILGVPDGNPILEALKSRNTVAYAMIEKRLGEAKYFAGNELTAADIMMLFPLTTMRAFAPTDIGSFANLKAYLRRIGERPAYQKAMKKGDPNMPPMLS
jgi:glutathione S-transferase